MKQFIVDAFTNHPFAGNSAAVCLFEESRSADWMQTVAVLGGELAERAAP